MCLTSLTPICHILPFSTEFMNILSFYDCTQSLYGNVKIRSIIHDQGLQDRSRATIVIILVS